MIEPVAVQNLMLATALGAAIVVLGAAYATLFAFARLLERPRLLGAAAASYLGLLVCVIAFAYVARLDGFWATLAVAMALGYLLAPLGIWRLCTGTHAATHEASTGDGHER